MPYVDILEFIFNALSILVFPLIGWYYRLQKEKFSEYQDQIDGMLRSATTQISSSLDSLRGDLNGLGTRISSLESNYHSLELRLTEKFVQKDAFADFARELNRLNQQVSDLRVENQKSNTNYAKDLASCQQQNCGVK